MKTKYYFIAMALSAIALQSCENDDMPTSENKLAVQKFTEKYPDATQAKWEQKGDYSVVDFYKNGKESEAWLDKQGMWYMTETDLSFNELPTAVKNAFSESEYATFRIDDIDMIERKDMETVYVLEVEKGNLEYDLYYSPNGSLIKIVTDTNNNNDDNERYLPVTIGNTITSYISTHYPQAKILETENERGMVEVDILDGTIHRELLFKANGEWVNTKTQVRKNSVPNNVIHALETSAYSSYKIDDIDYYETPQRNYYHFELESHSQEVQLIITLEGILEVVKISKD